MARDRSIFLIIFTKCMLSGAAYGMIGENVRDVEITENFPFVVSVSERSNASENASNFVSLHICTGTLVSHKSVLTAAHCLLHKTPQQIEIIAGSKNLNKGKKYYPVSWVTFDKWNHHQRTPYPQNNIAVIKMSGQGINSPETKPVPLLMVDNKYLSGKDVRMFGWGKNKNGFKTTALKKAKFKIVSNHECSIQGTMLMGKNFTVPPNYFCTKATPWIVSTPGDGGAPIYHISRHVVGINIGVVPKVEGYPQAMLNQLQMNSNLNFYYYSVFLKQNIIK